MAPAVPFATFEFQMIVGHLWVGTYFYLSGIWWTISILNQHSLSLAAQTTFKSSPWFPNTPRTKIPWECILSSIHAVFFISQNVWVAIDAEHRTTYGHYAHHAIICLFILVHQFVNVLQFFKVRLVPNFNYCTLSVLYAMGALVFSLHTQNRSLMDILCHKFIMWCFLILTVTALMECAHRSAVIFALVRAYMSSVLGTWFIHLPFILYPYPSMHHWNQNDREQNMIVASIFIGHCSVHVVALIAIVAMNNRIRRVPARPYLKEKPRSGEKDNLLAYQEPEVDDGTGF